MIATLARERATKEKAPLAAGPSQNRSDTDSSYDTSIPAGPATRQGGRHVSR